MTTVAIKESVYTLFNKAAESDKSVKSIDYDRLDIFKKNTYTIISEVTKLFPSALITLLVDTKNYPYITLYIDIETVLFVDIAICDENLYQCVASCQNDKYVISETSIDSLIERFRVIKKVLNR